ncbi:hypothetical protein [Paenibacillus sp. ISL-20]|uniref:hypothetical protein n=1 Tax=Paenibacillus sp. ISL-20 TaxID=2819163 RepID=UPI001BEA233A|nr:hypothetical protein [Paenibacillus sp. ISL-20]MBT2763308.1 hypothetical protein [Paenibacillus sp. ISL-20]
MSNISACLSTVILLLGILLYQTIPSIKGDFVLVKDRYNIIVDAERKNYQNIIRDDYELQDLISIMENINDKEYTYMYIDLSDEQGTMNYYRMRYSLLPAKSVKYQHYGYQPFDEKLYRDLIKQFKVDYIVVHKDNGILDYLGEDYINKENIVLRLLEKSYSDLRSGIEIIK